MVRRTLENIIKVPLKNIFNTMRHTKGKKKKNIMGVVTMLMFSIGENQFSFSKINKNVNQNDFKMNNI